MLALGRLRRWRSWRSWREVGLGKDVLIGSSVFGKRDINIIFTGPCADIDRLEADSPDAAKKDKDTHSDEEEMRGG